MTQSSFFCFEIFLLHLKLHCVTVTNSVSSFSLLRQGGQATTELSMRRAATSGQSGVVRRRWNSSWSIVGELGLGVDVWESLVRSPQANFLISGAIADGGLWLSWHLKA